MENRLNAIKLKIKNVLTLHERQKSPTFAAATDKEVDFGLGYGVMVAQEVLVLLVLVRTQVVQLLR